MDLTDAIKSIMKSKGIGARKLSERSGIAYANITPRKLKHCGLKTLTKLCDSLGVELCIIDGWRKYKLNNFEATTDVDTLFHEMNKISPDTEDRYLMKRGNEQAKKRYFEEERARTNCRGCKNCIVELEKDGRYWCKAEEDYVIRKECEKKDERDIPKVFRE